MSVRVNDRHISDIEYENTFSKLNQYLIDKLKRLPKRYRHFLRDPFNHALMEGYKEIMNMTNEFLQNKKQGVNRYRSCVKILNHLEQIISFSYTYWNLSGINNNEIKYVTSKQRQYWTAFVNKEIVLIEGVMDKCRKDESLKFNTPRMNAYKGSDFKNITFLNKLSELERIIYQRALHTNQDYRDVQMETLVELSRAALFNACEANRIFVNKDEKLFAKRKKYFSECVRCLMSMNRPIKELAFDHVFSEKELKKISTLCTESLSIVKSVKASDLERFKQ